MWSVYSLPLHRHTHASTHTCILTLQYNIHIHIFTATIIQIPGSVKCKILAIQILDPVFNRFRLNLRKTCEWWISAERKRIDTHFISMGWFSSKILMAPMPQWWWRWFLRCLRIELIHFNGNIIWNKKYGRTDSSSDKSIIPISLNKIWNFSVSFKVE